MCLLRESFVGFRHFNEELMCNLLFIRIRDHSLTEKNSYYSRYKKLYVAFQLIEALQGLTIKKIGCGTHFTIFLTVDGKVYSCGLERFTGLPETVPACKKPLLVRSFRCI